MITPTAMEICSLRNSGSKMPLTKSWQCGLSLPAECASTDATGDEICALQYGLLMKSHTGA